MSKVMHFEIAAEDPARALKFYSDVFGWTSTPMGESMEYHLLQTGPVEAPGINGAIMPAGRQPRGTVVNTITVDDLDSHIEKIIASGGKIHLPWVTVPGIGYLAYATDTEGTMFGVMQPDETAV